MNYNQFEGEKDIYVPCGQCGKRIKYTDTLNHIREEHPKHWKKLGFDKVDKRSKK